MGNTLSLKQDKQVPQDDHRIVTVDFSSNFDASVLGNFCVDNPFAVDDLGLIDCYDLGISPWGTL